MRKLAGLLLATAGLIGVPVAQGAQPLIIPLTAGDFTDPTTCGFPVAIHFTANGETAKIFTSGRTVITGPLKADFSANGKTVSLNISGPGIITVAADGTVVFVGTGVGGGLILLPDGVVTLAYVAGPVLVSLTGGPGVLEHGRVLLDICAALA
jgi:hypothetical protein